MDLTYPSRVFDSVVQCVYSSFLITTVWISFTVNVVIFASWKFHENCGKTFHAGVILTLLLLFLKIKSYGFYFVWGIFLQRRQHGVKRRKKNPHAKISMLKLYSIVDRELVSKIFYQVHLFLSDAFKCGRNRSSMIEVTITMIFDLLVSYIKFYYCFKFEHINQTTDLKLNIELLNQLLECSSAGTL